MVEKPILKKTSAEYKAARRRTTTAKLILVLMFGLGFYVMVYTKQLRWEPIGFGCFILLFGAIGIWEYILLKNIKE